MGRAPGGPTRRAEIVAEQKGCEPTLGGLESAEGFVLYRRDIDAGEVA